MLKNACLNPEILSILSKCGHGDKILIADGNYPIETGTNGNSKKAYINLTHGIPLATEVLKVFNETIDIEMVELMTPDESNESPVLSEIKKIIRTDIEFQALNRLDFYEACKKEDVKLAVATGEGRKYFNLLLTIGAI